MTAEPFGGNINEVISLAGLWLHLWIFYNIVYT